MKHISCTIVDLLYEFFKLNRFFSWNEKVSWLKNSVFDFCDHNILNKDKTLIIILSKKLVLDYFFSIRFLLDIPVQPYNTLFTLFSIWPTLGYTQLNIHL